MRGNALETRLPDPSGKLRGTDVGAEHTVQRSLVEPEARAAAYVHARVAGKSYLCLLDSGSDFSLIPSQFIGTAS